MDTMDEIASLKQPLLEIRQKHATDGQDVSAWEAIACLLESHPALCWEQAWLATMVGVHPSNRGGLGFVVTEAMVTAAKHTNAGYSYSKACEGAWAVRSRRLQLIVDSR